LPQRELSEPAVLGTPVGDCVPDSLAVPSPLITSKFEPESDAEVVETKGAKCVLRNDGEVEVLTENIPLQRFRKKAESRSDIVVDVAFLRHVIQVLITNHGIITTPRDLEQILSFFGDVDVRRERQVVKTRSAKNKGGCCSDVDVDEVVEIVQKVLVNGVNIIKQMPRFIGFLQELGLSI
jgi:hypothetical protein